MATCDHVAHFNNFIPQKVLDDISLIFKWSYESNRSGHIFDHHYTCSYFINLEIKWIKRLFGEVLETLIPTNIADGEFIRIDYDKFICCYYKQDINYNIAKSIYLNPEENNIIATIIFTIKGNIETQLGSTNHDHVKIINQNPGDVLLLGPNIIRQDKCLSNDCVKLVFPIIYKTKNQIPAINPVAKGKQLIVSNINKVQEQLVPESNGLKYSTTLMEIDGQTIKLVPSVWDKNMERRWNHVRYRQRIFDIAKQSVDPIIDTHIGRPPTDYEDWCPNCYEILPIFKEYNKCPGCLSKIKNVNTKLRDKLMKHGP